MKIVDLELANFRGFQKRHHFDLDADAVIMVASNGQGKTSIMDAIFWVLCGTVPRLGDDTKLLSLYSDTGEMEVVLGLRSADGEAIRIIRNFDGKDQHLSVIHGTLRHQGATAHEVLLRLIWPSALSAPDPNKSAAETFARSVYLQQDLLRDLVEGHTEQERFVAASELLGAGKVNDLQVKLDNARSAWSKATNILLDDVKPLRDRVSALEKQLSRLGARSSDSELTMSKWDDWWSRARQIGIETAIATPADSASATTEIESALRQSQAIRNRDERQRLMLQVLLQDLEQRQPPIALEDVGVLHGELEKAQQKLEATREYLRRLQDSVAEDHARQMMERNEQQELRSLAELALRHLGQRCPVCDQTFQVEATRVRLQELVKKLPPSGESVTDRAIEITRTVGLTELTEKAVSALERKIAAAVLAANARQAWLANREERLREVGIDSSIADPLTELRSRLKASENKATEVARLVSEGEKLALILTQLSESNRRQEIERDIREAKTQLEEATVVIRLREETGRLATNIVEGLRDAATEVVNSELHRLEPTLQRVYARIDPHPSFTRIKFVTRFEYRRGHLVLAIEDPISQIASEQPQYVLSSSQLNALAVSVFVALNLGMKDLPIQAAILDDPLQSLDDINLLGLVDLLLRMKSERQLFVSTHDARFGSLLERKLRAVSPDQRTTLINFGAWTREGPVLEQRDVTKDLVPLKIA